MFKLISVLKPFAMFTIFCLLVWSMVFFFLIGPCLLFIHYSCCPRESSHQPSQSKVSMTPMYFSEEAKLPLVVRSDPNWRYCSMWGKHGLVLNYRLIQTLEVFEFLIVMIVYLVDFMNNIYYKYVDSFTRCRMGSYIHVTWPPYDFPVSLHS